jgi:DDE family transposase
MPDCTSQRFEIQGPGRRALVADFSGGQITSDGGVILLGQVDRRRRVVERLAACFDDHRAPSRIEHSVKDLLRQRLYGLALGYEDLNDHEQLRSDVLLAATVGKAEPTGDRRSRLQDRGRALAGKSTLNRLEWSAVAKGAEERYWRIGVRPQEIDRLLVELFLEAHSKPPRSIVLDLDATDDPLHGEQEGRFFHGYYGCYCYLPLYIFCGDHLLLARLRRADTDASAGSVEELSRIVGQIRKAWPKVAIQVRADSGFAREPLMAWCEQNQVDYVFGLARNRRLEQALEPAFEQAEELCAKSGAPERVYAEWAHRTLDSWSRERRVIGKAEITERGENPRFIVTSLSAQQADAKTAYEKIYCARGEMENRIKEQQLDLYADRTSAHLMQVNQLRLWFASFAYILIAEIRRLGLGGSAEARARCQTIRLKLFKIGALVEVSRRRIWVLLSTACPYRDLFAYVFHRLASPGPLPA